MGSSVAQGFSSCQNFNQRFKDLLFMCLWSVLMLLEVFGVCVLIFLRFKEIRGKQNRGNIRLYALYYI